MSTQSMSLHARTLREHVKNRSFGDFFKALEKCRKDPKLAQEFGEAINVLIKYLSSDKTLSQNFSTIDATQRDAFLVPVINDLLEREYPVESASFLTGFLSVRTGEVYVRLCREKIRHAIDHHVHRENEAVN